MVRWVALGALILASACGRAWYEERPRDAGDSADAGDAGDRADGGDGGVPAEACRRPGCPGRCVPGGFGDEFEDTTAGNGWSVVVGSGGTAEEAGGVLTLQPGMDDEVLYQSELLYPLDVLTAEIAVTIADPSARSSFCFIAADDTFDTFGICQTGGDLRLFFGVSETESLPYDAAVHRHWRMRREGDQAIFEASPDGSEWTELGRGATAASTSAAFRLAANAWGLAMPGTTYTVDRVRGGTPRRTDGGAVGCALDGLFDDFGDDDPAGLWWSHVEDSSIVMESTGEMVIAPPWADGLRGQSFARTLDLWDLEGGAVLLQLDVTLSGGDSACGFEVRGIDGTSAGFEVHSGDLAPRTAAGALPDVRVTYDPTNHRWLRLSESAGTLLWEVSADGIAWEVVHSDTAPVYAPAVEVSLFATKYTGEATGYARFDDLNLPP